ncbi:zinc finger protein basonuclin-2-like [Apodemus sylvaticus]|uniref:zinc finger protein basonuclin-2-like n=1 Tax=Apodemus sylvaticus TaxID=10129 RepID=UPI0022437C7F|nr:zinc finger protein basonuclin-2-like [Apodemus sylvaticus]
MAHFVPSPPPNCLSYKSEGRLGDQDWQAHFKVPCCGVDPSQLESEEAEVDVRERDTQRDREPKRARDLTLRDSCTDNSMQFGTRTTAAGPGFMGTWQNADTNLLFRMSQQQRTMKQHQHTTFHNGNFLMTEEGACHAISTFRSSSHLTIAEEIITRNNFSFLFNFIVTNSFTHCNYFMLCITHILIYFNECY